MACFLTTWSACVVSPRPHLFRSASLNVFVYMFSRHLFHVSLRHIISAFQYQWSFIFIHDNNALKYVMSVLFRLYWISLFRRSRRANPVILFDYFAFVCVVIMIPNLLLWWMCSRSPKSVFHLCVNCVTDF